jgi:hypothetical protein
LLLAQVDIFISDEERKPQSPCLIEVLLKCDANPPIGTQNDSVRWETADSDLGLDELRRKAS